MSYETKQAILEFAGLSYVVLSEPLNGNVDGSNTVFTTDHKPLADGNYDDVVDTTDVTVYVDGSPVTVTAINVAAGALTLALAPTLNANVTADYVYSDIKDTAVENLRTEAQDHVDEIMGTLDTVPYVTVPSTVRKIVRWYAAGMLLTQDYGSGKDTDGTSKDGYKKIAQADEWLDKYLALGGQTGGSSTPDAQGEAQSDASLFDVQQPNGSYVPVDDSFIRDLPDTDTFINP